MLNATCTRVYENNPGYTTHGVTEHEDRCRDTPSVYEQGHAVLESLRWTTLNRQRQKSNVTDGLTAVKDLHVICAVI
jgi:hypothetical protein